MKKYLAILLSVLLLMTSVPMVVGAEAPALPEGPCFAVSYEEAKVGETVDVTISAVHNPGIVSTRVKLYYDTAVLKLTGIADGDFYAGGYSYGDVDAANEKGSIVVNWCYTTKADSTAELLATLTFEVLDGAYGPSAITIEFSCEDDVYNYDWDTVKFEPYHGQVYVLYPVTGITLNQTVLDIYNGDSAALTATVLAEGKTDETVIWTTDNPAVATVDDKGVVTATGLGTATVTATTAEGGYAASCAVNVTCAHRNVTEVAAVDSTCIQHGRGAYTLCTDCAVILSGSDAELPLVDHVYALIKEIAPTCTADGSKTYGCTVCGDTYTDTVPALGHDYNGVVTAPDCENGGYTTYTCAHCGDAYVAEPTEATGHNYVALSAEPPTCDVDGFERFYCTYCNDSYTVTIPALGHDYNGVVTAPDCENNGYTTYTCSVCGDSYVADEVTALGHKYANACDTDCDYCGDVRAITHAYVAEVTAPTCVTDGYTVYTCSVCYHSYTGAEVPALGHKTEIIKGYAPTCTVDGMTDSAVCTVCHEVVIPHQPIFAQGHALADVMGYDPTCTADGLTNGTYCTVCDEVLAEQEIIPALGHNYLIQEEMNATCVVDGYQRYGCHACGDTYTDVLPAVGHTAVVVKGYSPTCTAEGLTDGEKCSVCKEIITAQQVIPASGHSYDAVVTDPTCGADGYTTYTCSACGDNYMGDITPATGEHTYDDRDDRECNGCDHVRSMAGDADGNDKVNNRDLGLLQKFLNNTEVTVDQEAMDLDGNGKINNRDLGLLQRLLNQ